MQDMSNAIMERRVDDVALRWEIVTCEPNHKSHVGSNDMGVGLDPVVMQCIIVVDIVHTSMCQTYHLLVLLQHLISMLFRVTPYYMTC